MFKIPLFGKKKLVTAFEYGLTLAITANDLKIDLSKDTVLKAEEMIINELTTKPYEIVNKDMIPNLLAVLEPKD